MQTLQQILDELPGLDRAVTDACDWLADTAQVRTVQLVDAVNRYGHAYDDWRGAIRGEYDLKDQQWWFFCPMWHTSQAVKALTKAYALRRRENWLDAAIRGAQFVLRHQVRSGADAGLLLAYEDFADKVTISAALESVDGLIVLETVNDHERWADRAIEALRWCARRAWVRGEGLIRDLYDPRTGTFVDAYPNPSGLPGRPLLDDGVWLTAHQRTGDPLFRQIHEEILDRLAADENPAGNWLRYGPCAPDKGHIHPRHAYWWGRPMLAAWRATGDRRRLEMARRAGEWYRGAQRLDGGVFRDTDLSFNSPCFGQSTSGAMCAAILWIELYQATADACWLEPIHHALSFGCGMQFQCPQDRRLNGALIEGTFPPDGTQRCPYFIRDLATIFFVQAATALMEAATPQRRLTAGHPAPLVYIAEGLHRSSLAAGRRPLET